MDVNPHFSPDFCCVSQLPDNAFVVRHSVSSASLDTPPGRNGACLSSIGDRTSRYEIR
jgi:hypothetical protein